MSSASFKVITLITLVAIAASAACAKKPRTGRADAPPPRLEVESGNLRAVPGFTGDKIGVEVERVTPLDGENLQLIDLRIPLDSGLVDEIEVVAPDGQIIEQGREAEISAGQDSTGVKLYLPRRKNWEFRLRLLDVPEEN